jgi:hypothetical protein
LCAQYTGLETMIATPPVRERPFDVQIVPLNTSKIVCFDNHNDMVRALIKILFRL